MNTKNGKNDCSLVQKLLEIRKTQRHLNNLKKEIQIQYSKINRPKHEELRDIINSNHNFYKFLEDDLKKDKEVVKKGKIDYKAVENSYTRYFFRFFLSVGCVRFVGLMASLQGWY